MGMVKRALQHVEVQFPPPGADVREALADLGRRRLDDLLAAGAVEFYQPLTEQPTDPAVVARIAEFEPFQEARRNLAALVVAQGCQPLDVEASKRLAAAADRVHTGRAELAEQHYKLAIWSARRFGSAQRRDELAGIAFLGLVRAVERFDPAGGGTLANYASWWMRTRVWQHLSRERVARRRVPLLLNREDERDGRGEPEPALPRTRPADRRELDVETAQLQTARMLVRQLVEENGAELTPRELAVVRAVFLNTPPSAPPASTAAVAELVGVDAGAVCARLRNAMAKLRLAAETHLDSDDLAELQRIEKLNRRRAEALERAGPAPQRIGFTRAAIARSRCEAARAARTREMAKKQQLRRQHSAEARRESLVGQLENFQHRRATALARFAALSPQEQRETLTKAAELMPRDQRSRRLQPPPNWRQLWAWVRTVEAALPCVRDTVGAELIGAGVI